MSDKIIKTHPRSFGFEFRNMLLEGTLQNVDGKNDIFFFFDGQQYPDGLSFGQANNITEQESQFINTQINNLINKP